LTYLTPCPSCGEMFTPERRKMHLCQNCRLDRQRREQDSRDRWRSVMDTPVPCLMCGRSFRTLAGSGKFCSECAPGRRRKVNAANERRKYQEEHSTAIHAAWLQGTTADLYEAGHADSQDLVPLLPAGGQPLVGATTPAGPEIGYSTFSVEFQGQLAQLRREACHDGWWRDNPHWAFALDTPTTEVPIKLTVDRKCGDQRGTQAGYQRHRYAKEAACPECAAAQREYMRKYRATRVGVNE
jgi:hypothetical protein